MCGQALPDKTNWSQLSDGACAALMAAMAAWTHLHTAPGNTSTITEPPLHARLVTCLCHGALLHKALPPPAPGRLTALNLWSPHGCWLPVPPPLTRVQVMAWLSQPDELTLATALGPENKLVHTFGPCCSLTKGRFLSHSHSRRGWCSFQAACIL